MVAKTLWYVANYYVTYKSSTWTKIDLRKK